VTDDSTWTPILEALAKAEDLVRADTRIVEDLATVEGTRYLTRLFSQGALNIIENGDAAYPQLTHFESPWIQWGLPNPDFVYWQAPLHGQYRYRITGTRGTARALLLETYDGSLDNFSGMRVIDSKLHHLDGGGDLIFGPDGELDIALGGEPAEGNWLALPIEAGTLTIREMYYDWETERPSQLSIERVGATYPAPVLTAEHLTGRLERFTHFLTDVHGPITQAINQHYSADPGLIAFGSLTMGTGGMGIPTQFYGTGTFHCEPDQAVVLTVTPPECAYWGFHLASQYWESMDWHLRSTSINGHQANLDPDGAFRAVIAHQDPGVPNWLDPCGHIQGLVAGRYTRAGSAPVPTLTTVPLTELREAIHPDTPAVTEQQRSELLRRRALSLRPRQAD
jgi:hypothetical protein